MEGFGKFTIFKKRKEKKVSQRSILKDVIPSWVGKPKGTF
jgi:hypothetical protein